MRRAFGRAVDSGIDVVLAAIALVDRVLTGRRH